ncbi:hypothetical protein CLV30_103100 [Haloactinopolyspora alba]|uniref:Golvesin/Xly CBD-like domain-containing protein n=1 Tax=Haloactinopolyspora alba TaxID=648780 RepID=A0A2P8E931_9ACTN|nr:hypothetical protein [Haloactinopolyspora alba]PSL05948.1 hypothetical protein CLV30_103100 [Haloactinopolyspora alba]
MTERQISRRSILTLAGAGVGAAAVQHMIGPLHPAMAALRNTPASEGLPAPLRKIEKPGLTIAEDPAAVVTGPRHRVSFRLATWDGGRTYVRDIEVRADGGWISATSPDARFDEQWVVLAGADGSKVNYYASMTPHWLALDEIEQVDDTTVRLTTSADLGFDIAVRWNVAGENPEVQWTVTAGADGHHIVGYQAMDIARFANVEEVLCGALQHARVVDGADSLNASELFAPMSLVQQTVGEQVWTTGVYLPPESEDFVHLARIGFDNQPYGMSLRNGDVDPENVQAVVFAPQIGEQSPLEAGGSRTMSFGVCAEPADLYTAYTGLARQEYGLRAYRENVFGTSLTEAAFNLIDLVMREPDQVDPQGGFVPSPSGWWERAKGFVDIENDQTVVISHAAVLMSAYRLTGDDAIYDRRARPVLEHLLSRETWGNRFTPVIGGHDRYPWGISGPAGDAAHLIPLLRQGASLNPVVRELAVQTMRERPRRPAGSAIETGRTPMTVPYVAQQFTGSPAYLAEAHANAAVYADQFVNRAYTTNAARVQFVYDYAKDWTELLLVAEATGDEALMEAAYREAKRFVTEMQVREVPDTLITTPTHPELTEQTDKWQEHGRRCVWDGYTRTEIPVEEVPAWVVSTCGLPTEQLSTHRLNGKYNLPHWSAFLQRLAWRTGDAFIHDVAHNGVVGRFTNYPGYNLRQFTSWPMHPEFPLEGPPGAGAVYYHHIPSHLGITLDYLFTEHLIRSDGAVAYPGVFEDNYVFFKFHTYGHAPGTFYGEDGVWPCLRRGIVDVDNHQINWIAGTGNGSLYISLTNESAEQQTARITFDPGPSAVASLRSYSVEVIRDNGEREERRVQGAQLSVPVTGRGITAVIVRGVNLSSPLHVEPEYDAHGPGSFHFDDESPVGLVRGMVLVRPDRGKADAYVFAGTEDQATLRYTLDGETWTEVPNEVYPNEWTVALPDLDASFTYEVVVGDARTEAVTLSLPASVTGVCPPGKTAHAELLADPDVAGGDPVVVEVRAYNGTDGRLEGARVALRVPDGWTVTPTGDQPTAIGGDPALWTFEVTVPVDAAAEMNSIGATLSWDGGVDEAAAVDVRVMETVEIVAFDVPEPEVQPGASIPLAVYAMNRGPAERGGPVTVLVPSGWTLEPAEQEYRLEPRGWARYDYTLTAPADAAPYTTHQLTARVENTEREVSVSVVSPGLVITNNSDVGYFETGEWARSGLRGVDGETTRYSRTGQKGSTATWQPWIPEAGLYELAVWYPYHDRTTTAAVYTVHHAGGKDSFTVNQQENAGEWRVMGTFRFDAGDAGLLRLEVQDTSSVHRASGARWRPVDDLVVTNNSSVGYSETGAWARSGLLGVDGERSRYSRIGEEGSTATWQPWIPESGRYEVAVWYPSDDQTTTAAVYTVHHAGGEDTFTVNQQENGGEWRVLGTFGFDPGDEGFVRLEVHDASRVHRASGARWRPVRST